MSVNIEFVTPTIEHVEFVAEHMREADIAEIKASHNHTPRQALNLALIDPNTMTALVSEEPVAMFGFSKPTVLSTIGTPWMLGTNVLFHHGKSLLVFGRVIVKMMLDECDILENYVHVDNKRSIRWLKALGFQFDDPKPYGFHKELFMKFHMRKENHV